VDERRALGEGRKGFREGGDAERTAEASFAAELVEAEPATRARPGGRAWRGIRRDEKRVEVNAEHSARPRHAATGGAGRAEAEPGRRGASLSDEDGGLVRAAVVATHGSTITNALEKV